MNPERILLLTVGTGDAERLEETLHRAFTQVDRCFWRNFSESWIFPTRMMRRIEATVYGASGAAAAPEATSLLRSNPS